jgi:hypothetical protein
MILCDADVLLNVNFAGINFPAGFQCDQSLQIRSDEGIIIQLPDIWARQVSSAARAQIPSIIY